MPVSPYLIIHQTFEYLLLLLVSVLGSGVITGTETDIGHPSSVTSSLVGETDIAQSYQNECVIMSCNK